MYARTEITVRFSPRVPLPPSCPASAHGATNDFQPPKWPRDDSVFLNELHKCAKRGRSKGAGKPSVTSFPRINARERALSVTKVSSEPSLAPGNRLLLAMPGHETFSGPSPKLHFCGPGFGFLLNLYVRTWLFAHTLLSSIVVFYKAKRCEAALYIKGSSVSCSEAESMRN